MSSIVAWPDQKCRGGPSECKRSLNTKKPEDYSQDWDGVIELLDDVDLQTLAEDVKHALSYVASAKMST